MTASLIVNGVEFQGTPLSSEEQVAFDAAMDLYIAPLVHKREKTLSQVVDSTPQVGQQSAPQPTVVERDVTEAWDGIAQLYQDHRADIYAAVQIAKTTLSGTFKGISGLGQELVISHLAPWHILRKATAAAETPSETWDNLQSAAASGTIVGFSGGLPVWVVAANNYLGWGAANATAANMDKRALVLVLGYTELLSNGAGGFPLRSIQFVVNGTTWGPTQLHPTTNLAPNNGRYPIVPAYSPILIGPRGVYSATVYSAEATASIPVILGVTIGQASYMNNHVLATVSL